MQCFAAKAPKYVFLFIGDGMGVNQVNFSEMYLSSMNGKIGVEPLLFSQFPTVGFATTYSASSLVTDSAASGTAIATGHKTTNGYLGVDPDGGSLESVAAMAKRNGKKVAIMTTVTINHATPGAFYAHQDSRNKYDEISQDLAASGFDYFAGDGFERNKTIFAHHKDIEDYIAERGYTFAYSRAEFEAKYKDADKMMLIPDREHGVENCLQALSFSPEEKAKHVNLQDMVETSLEFLMKDGCKQGFFLMAEGGEIDHECHGNDAAAMLQEVYDFDRAIKVAYDFYLQHPDETIIVITADHETGGIVLKGNNPKQYSMLQYQRTPQSLLSKELRNLMKSQEEVVSWEQVKELLSNGLGLWKDIPLSESEEAEIRAEYDKTVARREAGHVVDPYAYADNAKIVNVAVRILDNKAGVHWTTGGHTAGFVPVYAIGKGTEIFSAKNDNTQICKKIAKIARYK